MTDDRPAAAAGFSCSNCGEGISDHCRVHAIPCCPGKCPGPSQSFRPTPEPAPADPLSRDTVQHALDKAWLASNDAHGMARPPDLARHLYEALRASSRGAPTE